VLQTDVYLLSLATTQCPILALQASAMMPDDVGVDGTSYGHTTYDTVKHPRRSAHHRVAVSLDTPTSGLRAQDQADAAARDFFAIQEVIGLQKLLAMPHLSEKDREDFSHVAAQAKRVYMEHKRPAKKSRTTESTFPTSLASGMRTETPSSMSHASSYDQDEPHSASESSRLEDSRDDGDDEPVH
jgi:hypothetical protein